MHLFIYLKLNIKYSKFNTKNLNLNTIYNKFFMTLRVKKALLININLQLKYYSLMIVYEYEAQKTQKYRLFLERFII